MLRMSLLSFGHHIVAADTVSCGQAVMSTCACRRVLEKLGVRNSKQQQLATGAKGHLTSMRFQPLWTMH